MKIQMKISRQKKPSHKFWQGFKSPVAVAHRAGDAAGIEKENSLKAFEAAYKLGYRWYETDVVATKDKKLLAIHGRGYQLRPNRDLPSRTKLRRMPYIEASKLRVGEEKIPLLDELLDRFPDVKFFVDPKTYGSVPALIDCLSRRPQDIERVCIGAFSKIRTMRCAYIIKKNTGKEVCTCLLGPINSYPIYVAARIKLLRHFAKYYVKETNAHSIHVPYRWIANSPKAGGKLVDYAHELGLKVGVYTPNTKKSIKQNLEGGADIVFSDRVELLRQLVSSKHKK